MACLLGLRVMNKLLANTPARSISRLLLPVRTVLPVHTPVAVHSPTDGFILVPGYRAPERKELYFVRHGAVGTAAYGSTHGAAARPLYYGGP